MKNHDSKFKNIIIALIIGFALFPAITFAAELYLEPTSGKYHLGDTFIIEIKIDTEEECINTVKADLEFSQDILNAVDFSQGNSILTLWVKPPEIIQESGLISFVGGIPGGYCGKIPGDSEENNLLGKIIFKVSENKTNQAEVKFLDSSQVLLNDGLGTPAKLSTRGAIFTILAEEIEPARDEWQEELEKDNVLPEPFKIEINQDPSIFEGKYFIIFSTTDKQTGIDYYEVKEGKRDWQETISPYLLEDQSLKSIIKVKAIDKAGNERIEEIIPLKEITWQDISWAILILIVGGIIWWIVRKIKK